MWQTIIDVDGDGRPDLVFKKSDKVRVAYNRPGVGRATTLGAGLQGIVPLSDNTFTGSSFSAHTMTKRRFWYESDGAFNQNTMDVWRQAIDVNGDGRIDIVDAAEEPGH
jgi:hypothetical protein